MKVIDKCFKKKEDMVKWITGRKSILKRIIIICIIAACFISVYDNVKVDKIPKYEPNNIQLERDVTIPNRKLYLNFLFIFL